MTGYAHPRREISLSVLRLEGGGGFPRMVVQDFSVGGWWRSSSYSAGMPNKRRGAFEEYASSIMVTFERFPFCFLPPFICLLIPSQRHINPHIPLSDNGISGITEYEG